MEQDQTPFTVIGYSFLKAGQIDAILQDIMATNWYSQWVPKRTLTIRAEMRPNLSEGWKGVDYLAKTGGFMPTKREIAFSLSINKETSPEVVKQITKAFSEAFNTGMKKLLHGVKPDPSEPVVNAATKELIKSRRELQDKKPELNLTKWNQQQSSEWERYPIKAQVRGARPKKG